MEEDTLLIWIARRAASWSDILLILTLLAILLRFAFHPTVLSGVGVVVLFGVGGLLWLMTPHATSFSELLYPNQQTFHVRIETTFSVGGKEFTAASVQGYRFRQSQTQWGEMETDARVFGEAAWVRPPGGPVLVVLMRGPKRRLDSYEWTLWRTCPPPEQEGQGLRARMAQVAQRTGSCSVPKQYWPEIVSLAEPSQLTSVSRVNLGRSLPGYPTSVTVSGVTLTVTDEPITATLKSALPFLSDESLNYSRLLADKFSDSLPLYRTDFVRAPHW